VFGDIRNYECWAWTWSNDFESRKFKLELVCVIVVIFGVKSEYEVLDNLSKSTYGDLVVNLKCKKLGFHDHAWVWWIFESNMLIWIKLDEI